MSELAARRLARRSERIADGLTECGFESIHADEERGPKAKRPYLATECHDVVEADRWRGQVIRDIGRQVMAIQNAGLGEHKCVSSPTWCHSSLSPM